MLAEALQPLKDAIAQGQPLRITGHGSKDFYGGDLVGTPLSTQALNGVTAYEPSELFVSVLAGTPIAGVEALLLQQRQQAVERAQIGPAGGIDHQPVALRGAMLTQTGNGEVDKAALAEIGVRQVGEFVFLPRAAGTLQYRRRGNRRAEGANQFEPRWIIVLRSGHARKT
jgi:hypothetical protein